MQTAQTPAFQMRKLRSLRPGRKNSRSQEQTGKERKKRGKEPKGKEIGGLHNKLHLYK
jgi:hypothetical protein